MNLKSQDVRIGNYIAFGTIMCRVSEIHPEHFYVESVENQESFKTTWAELSYVPLDDNWLERLPMVRRPDRDDPYGGWLIRVHPDHYIRIKNNKWDSGVTDIDLTYVHQLQNLYKILTNSELY